MTSAWAMVRLLWVMTTNCVVALISCDQLGEAAHVGLVERSVDLVEDAEGRGLELEDADQQRERGERLFAAREQKDVLQLLARRRGDDVDAALGGVLRVGEPHRRPGRRRRAW